MPPRIGARKLLIASVGVATINYVAAACGGATTTDYPTSGNLPIPQPTDAAATDVIMIPPTSANLPAPQFDASDDADDASDASDDADGS